MKKILQKIKQFNKKRLVKIIRFSIIAKIIVLAILAWFGVSDFSFAKETHYMPEVSFNANSYEFLETKPRTVAVYPGLSNTQMQEKDIYIDPVKVELLAKEMSRQYNVDWKLVYAIGYHESANFNSALARRNNNFFGRKARNGEYAQWSTPEEGIRDEFEYLKDHYIDRGLDTPAKINRIYAEDKTWHIRVESIINKLS